MWKGEIVSSSNLIFVPRESFLKSKMRPLGLFRNKARFRARTYDTTKYQHSRLKSPCASANALVFACIMQLVFVVSGEVLESSSAISSSSILLAVNNLGAFLLIYSAIPHFSLAKTVRNGKIIETEAVTVEQLQINTTLPTSVLTGTSNETETNKNSTSFSSRTLVASEETTTLTPSEEMEATLDSSEEKASRNQERWIGMNRLKRQMGVAAEIALIAPALQTMGCIPKFFCGLNSKPPNQESSALNDVAYLIKFAMMDDDEVQGDDPLFGDKTKNTRGKDGLNTLTRVKEDLILENMAEEELVKEDPAYLKFVWKDMEDRIKTKPGNKVRLDDVMDEIIVEPEQTAVGSLFTGIKSVLRIGRSVDHILNRTEVYTNDTSQVTGQARSFQDVEEEEESEGDGGKRARQMRLRQRWKKRPFWATPQFRQDMELAERIGKTEQDEGKCSSTFSVCPYTPHEMMEIVHGGYKKKQKEMNKKKKPQWYLNADGPPKESSEEDDTEVTRKPVKDPDNLVTTTTIKPIALNPKDPENQIYYAMFPHKAVEKGMTTVRTTRRPVTRRPIAKRPPASRPDTEEEERPEVVYDIGPRPHREHRKPPMQIQGHPEYDDGSLEGHKRPRPNNMQNHRPQPPPRKTSWFSFGGSNKRPQQPPQRPGQKPFNRGNNGPPQFGNENNPTGSSSDAFSDEDGNDDENLDESSEEHGKQKKTQDKNGSGSDSGENEGMYSEDKGSKVKHRRRPELEAAPTFSSTPAPSDITIQLPPELQNADPNIQILGIQEISSGGDMFPTGLPQQHVEPQPLQPFVPETKPKQGPIQPARQKYKIVRERKHKQKKKVFKDPPTVTYNQQSHPQQNIPSPTGVLKEIKTNPKEDKSNEENSNEEDEESRENSSEEKAVQDEEIQPINPVNPPRLQHRPMVTFQGRPSEEFKDPDKHHVNGIPPHGNGSPQNSASNEDENSDEEARNSNSAATETLSNELSVELANIPQPARPPHQHTGSTGPPQHPHHGQHNPQHLQTTTQKYSSGILGYFFGKDKQQQRPPMIPGTGGGRPHPQSQQDSPLNVSEQDDDDEEDDDKDSSEEHGVRTKKPFIPAKGKYELDHLEYKPGAVKPLLRPQRPYRGSTSMEDSDEKRGRSTPPSPTVQQTVPAPTKPVVYRGSYKESVNIPPPATPPQRVHTPPTFKQEVTKSMTKKESEEDELESDEKASEESKEDDDNSSEEKSEKKTKKETLTKLPARRGSQEVHGTQAQVPLPPVANFPSTSQSKPALSTSKPVSSKQSQSTKNRADNDDASNEKQNDSTQDDSEEDDAKKQSDEDSAEDGSSEEKKNPKKTKPLPKPTRKPEDDELEQPSSQYPKQAPVVGDITAIGEILGVPQEDNTDDEPNQYGPEGDIPAAPPLALQSPFAPSLEIQIPKGTPAKVPPGVPLTEFYQGQGNLAGGPASGPGLPITPQQAQLAPVNPTSLLGLAQQGNPQTGYNQPGPGQPLQQIPGQTPGQSPGQGGAPANQPSDQFQQGIRNPLGQTGNRGPGNRQPGQQSQQGQNGQGQQGQNNRRRPGNRRPSQQENEDSSEENNSSEEDKEGHSSEEKPNKSNENEKDGDDDEAVAKLGQKEKNEDDDDEPEQDTDKEPPPPPPPPIYTGTQQQKQELQSKPFLPRPVSQQKPVFYRPNPGRREPILKHQLSHNQEILHFNRPSPMRPHQALRPNIYGQHTKHPAVFPMRPSAAANLKPFMGVQRPVSSLTNSFSVSHLLRPLLAKPQMKRKPLDPKVVQWVKEVYGIPDVNGPNRSGLQSDEGQDKKKVTSSTTKRPKYSSKEADKPKREKTKPKSSKKKSTTVKPSGSAERRNSGEIFPTKATTTTTTKSTTTYPPSTASTTVLKRSTTTPVPSTTTRTTTTTTVKPSTTLSTTTPTPTTTKRRYPPDYITEEQEAKMAQALFDSSEERLFDSSEEVKVVSEEQDEEEPTTTQRYTKSKLKTKVSGSKLIITVKSVPKNKTSEESGKPIKNTSVEKKRPVSSSREKLDKYFSKSASKNSSREKTKGKSSEDRRKSSSTEKISKFSKRRSPALESKSKTKPFESTSTTTTTTINPKYILKLRSTSKPKRIRLPPIYGKYARRTG